MPLVIEKEKEPSNPQVVSKEAEAAKLDQVKGADSSVGVHGYSLVQQIASQDSYGLILTKQIPTQLMARYRRLASQRASVQKLDDGTWYAWIDSPGFEGVWSNEDNLMDCLNVLDEVLLDWLLLKIKDEDRDIPVLGNIDLNML